MIDWYMARVPVIEAVEKGAHHIRDTAGDPTVGPVTWERLNYPHVEVLPESSEYQGGNEFAHLVRVNVYFERSKGDGYLDHLRVAMDAVNGATEALKDEPHAVTWRPESIQDFAGEVDNTLVLLISTQLRVTSLTDLSDS